MPDWFYRTVSRPVLFRLTPRVANRVTLRFMGALARVPLGGHVIDFLGHMAPPLALRKTFAGVTFRSSVGMSCHLDNDALALPALARFGFGFLEIGPICVKPIAAKSATQRLVSREAIRCFPSSSGLEKLLPRIEEASRLGLPIIAHLHSSSSDCATATREIEYSMRELAPFASLFSVAICDAKWRADDWRHHVQSVVAVANDLSRSVILRVHTEERDDDGRIEVALQEGVAGLQLSGALCDEDESQLIGAPVRSRALEKTHHLRASWPEVFLIGAGGIHQPQDALDFYEAGADVVLLDSGLVFSGPGLPKRINEALLWQHEMAPPVFADPEAARVTAQSWFWTLLMGLGMLFGSALTLAIAATRVLLPYDEAFLGMSRAQMNALNVQILPFMMHDRVTLAGAMVALGVLYVGLSLGGVRRGMHWAQKTIFVSAFTGFGSFFFFLGFGYLDTLHAFVTSCLLQLLLLGVHSRLGTPQPQPTACLRNDRAWHWSLWG